MAAIRRELGVRPVQKAPLMTDLVRQMLEKIPSDTVAGLRDRALLLLGFSSGRRRSELVGLYVEDLREVPEGYRVLIRRSETDQEGRGQEIGIPYGKHSETCPVGALKAYLKVSGLESGPLFRPATRKGELRKGRRVSAYRAPARVRALERRHRTSAGTPEGPTVPHVNPPPAIPYRRWRLSDVALSGVNPGPM